MEPTTSDSANFGATPSRETVGELLEGFRPRLQRMLTLRLDPRLRRRVDPADILQETFAEVVLRLDEYFASRPMPFYLWVRFLTAQKLVQLHRHHLGAARRDAAREESQQGFPTASTPSRAALFVHSSPSPSETLARAEALARVRAALDRLDPVDHQVLALRYFEFLSTEETAHVLGLTTSGVAKRQLRALGHLKRELQE